tara:strand:+ start:1529 stop:2176 length:648 start_codon:yes stop_codon:yes gene_type:complete
MNENQTQIMSPLSNESLFVIGDTEPYSDSNFDGEEEYYDIYDRIFMEDQDLVDSDKEDNQYLIGGCYTTKHREISKTLEHIYLSIALKPNTFFKTEYKVIQEYLKVYGFGGIYSTQPIWINNPLIRTSLPTLEIMQMKIKAEGQFCHNIVILKTTWLRLVQRKWRTIFNERKRIVKERMKVSSQKYWELYGKYPNNCRYLPKLKGMLSDLLIKAN